MVEGEIVIILEFYKFKVRFIVRGKSMVRWLMFDILKSSHLTLVTILAFKIIIKL